MNISKETKNKLIELLRLDIAKNEIENKRMQKDISELLNGNGSIQSLSHSVKSTIKKTFKTIILGLLADGKPKTSRELLTHYVKERGKDIDMPSFSSQLSPMVHKVKCIKMHTIAGNPIDSKHYYCLPDWFQGDKLKQEYKNKIKDEAREALKELSFT